MQNPKEYKEHRSHNAEGDEQAALFEWAEFATGRHPELRLMYHIPNGGHRHIAVARKLKAEGVKAGVPDIFLPAPKGKFNGMYLEMKTGYNNTTKHQKRWIENLSEQGYFCAICWGMEDAIQALEEYLTQ